MKITIEHNGKTYEFDSGTKTLIFDAGIMNGFEDDKLLEFVEFVHMLYLKDHNPTPLGRLCDYVAEHWDKGVIYLDRSTILEEFYDSLD